MIWLVAQWKNARYAVDHILVASRIDATHVGQCVQKIDDQVHFLFRAGYPPVVEQSMELRVAEIPYRRCISGHALVNHVRSVAYVPRYAQASAALTHR